MPSHLVRRYKGRKKRRRSREERGGGSMTRSNPPLFTDLVEFVGPGFAAFAVSRFGTRILATQVGQRKPSWGKHAGGVAAVSAFLGAWLLAHRVRMLEKYHTPIVVGSAIAMLQSLIQLYVPRLGWVVSDASPELASAAAPAQVASGSPQTTSSPLPAGYTSVDEDPSLYVYDDRYDSGRVGQTTQQARAQQADDIDAGLDDLDSEDDLQTMGTLG